MDQIISQFGLNAGLLLAQVLNFGIILFVLYKLVYHPILNILDKRRETIENNLKEAKAVEARVAHLEEELKARHAEAKKQAEAIIAEAKQIGAESRTAIMAKAEEEATRILAKAEEELTREREEMLREVEKYIVKFSLIVTEQVYKKLDVKTREKLTNETVSEISSKLKARETAR